jgi:hypothetical protein
MRQLTFRTALALDVAVSMSWAVPALAVPITYTETVTATGSLGGVAFSNAAIVLTMHNDTTNVIGGPSFFENLGIVTVSVNGGSPMTFTNSTEVFSAPTPPPSSAGFSDLTRSLDILDVSSPSFATYTLQTAIGPISGAALISPGEFFPTTGGTFALTGVTGLATFTATTTSPAPAPPIGRGLPALLAVFLGVRLWQHSKRRRSLET